MLSRLVGPSRLPLLPPTVRAPRTNRLPRVPARIEAPRRVAFFPRSGGARPNLPRFTRRKRPRVVLHGAGSRSLARAFGDRRIGVRFCPMARRASAGHSIVHGTPIRSHPAVDLGWRDRLGDVVRTRPFATYGLPDAQLAAGSRHSCDDDPVDGCSATLFAGTGPSLSRAAFCLGLGSLRRGAPVDDGAFLRLALRRRSERPRPTKAPRRRRNAALTFEKNQRGHPQRCRNLSEECRKLSAEWHCPSWVHPAVRPCANGGANPGGAPRTQRHPDRW